ncbi:hypothetical protein [Desulfoluna sp.]|uniref:hypothetical protein n=1 Tax=Desulfoluna sp. TaxID=2045199 RepID=UPI002632011F|nr:hypothetical protein [Desulfoluna sp.]
MFRYLAWGLPAAMVSCITLPPDSSPGAQAACFWFAVLFFVAIAAHLMDVTVRWESQWPEGRKRSLAFLLSGSLLVWGLLFYTGRAGLWRGGVPAIVFSANLLLMAGLVGRWLASGIRRPSELLPVCAVVCAADLVSFFKGPTGAMADGVAAYYAAGMVGPPPWADFLLVKIPVPGISNWVPLFGVTDWAVAACLTDAYRRLSLDRAGARGEGASRGVMNAFPSPAVAGLLAAIVLAHVTGRFVPGMPMMVLFYLPVLLARSRQARRPRRHEVWLALLFPLVIALAGRLM